MNKKGQEKTVAFIVVFVILVIAGIIIGSLGFDSVDASHLGVKVKLGEIQGTMTPGFAWTGLLVHTYQYDMRVRSMTVQMVGEESATDKDGQAVYGNIAVNYRLKHNASVVESLYANIGKDDVVDEILLIEPIIREGYKQATVQYEAMEILENRQSVKEEAKRIISENFPSEYFEIENIVVSNIDFSQEFKDAIEDKKVATQEKLKEQEMVEVVKAQQEQEIEKYKAEAEKLKLQKNELNELLVMQQLIDKWDGTTAQTVIISGEDTGNNMLLQLATGNLNFGSN